MSDTSLTVIGAGAVGLAVAARLAGRFPDLILLERRDHHGTETSSRNSEVIHAGMYYTPGSLKARLCVEGNRLLYEYCEKRQVPHNRCTKIIVAMIPEEVAHLEKILATGRTNGVELEMITGEKSRELEPSVPAVAAVSIGFSRSYAPGHDGDRWRLLRTGPGYFFRGVQAVAADHLGQALHRR